MIRKYELRSIDSWRDDGGWYWNNSYTVERGLVIHDDDTTPRKIFKLLRSMNMLHEAESKGRVRLDDAWPYLTIEDRVTGEQLFCLICEEEEDS